MSSEPGWERYEPIPPVFKKLHPNLTPANYALLKKDPLFLYSRMAVCDQCFLLLTAEHAPSLPIVERMPSSLLMERNLGSIQHSIGASLGVPVQENLSMLRQSSVSPVAGMQGAHGGRDSVLSGKETRMGFYQEGGEQSRLDKGGGRDRSPAGRSHSSLGGMAVTNRRQNHGDRSHSSLAQSHRNSDLNSLDASSLTAADDDRYVKKASKPRLVPPLDTGNPVKLAGYTYAGNSALSRAPRRSTRVAENFVSSVATSQFTKKVEERVQPLQLTPAPQALDFVANKALPAARSLLPENRGLKGLPDTSLALSVLEGEEAFLRSLPPGAGEAMHHQGPFSEEERRIARAAATGAKKKLQARKKGAGVGAPKMGVAPEESSESSLGGRGSVVGVEMSGDLATEASSASVLSLPQGPIRKGRAKSWLDSSPLLPGGGGIAAGVRRGGAAAHIDGEIAWCWVQGWVSLCWMGVAVCGCAWADRSRVMHAEYSMYLAAGSGVAKAMATAAGDAAEGGQGGGGFEKWAGPKAGADGGLPEGVVAAIELAKVKIKVKSVWENRERVHTNFHSTAQDLKAQKLKEEHAAKVAAEKARKEADEKQRQAEMEYR